jgi:hypothetical protein
MEGRSDDVGTLSLLTFFQTFVHCLLHQSLYLYFSKLFLLNFDITALLKVPCSITHLYFLISVQSLYLDTGSTQPREYN